MQGGVIELAWQAAAAARAERGVRGPARRRPVRRYRGVMKRGDRYVAQIMDAAGLRPVCLGSYATPEEAAYAYAAAARIMRGDKAKPNFPEPPAPAVGAGGGTPAARARVVLPLLGHARVRAPLNGQLLAPAPVGGGAQCQAAFSAVQLAPHFLAPPVPYHRGRGAAPAAFSQFLYRPAAGPAFAAAAGGSNGAGFYGPALAAAAAGGSNGGAGFFGMAPMIGPEAELLMPTYAAISALRSSYKKNYLAVDAPAAADPKLAIIFESGGGPMVEDNFTGDGGASTSSAARPAVPPLRLKDLMESEIVRRSADD